MTTAAVLLSLDEHHDAHHIEKHSVTHRLVHSVPFLSALAAVAVGVVAIVVGTVALIRRHRRSWLNDLSGAALQEAGEKRPLHNGSQINVLYGRM